MIGNKIKVLHTNNGVQYAEKTFKEFCVRRASRESG